MGTNHGQGDPAAFEADVIYQQLVALTDASTQRHRLAPGSAEYESALEIEQRLADDIWQLATDLRRNGPDSEPADRPEPET